MTHGTGFGNGLTWVADFEGSEAEWERPLKWDVYKTPETSGGGVIGRGPGPNRGRPRGMLRSSRDPQSGSSRDRGRTRQDQQWHRGLRGCGMLGNRQCFPSSRASGRSDLTPPQRRRPVLGSTLGQRNRAGTRHRRGRPTGRRQSDRPSGRGINRQRPAHRRKAAGESGGPRGVDPPHVG